MSTADPDDDEKTITGPPTPGGRRLGASDEDAATGLQAERRRGRAAAAQQPGHTLPIGTRLRDYEITGLIGEGGFGIVYLAWDHSLQRKVAIKEYMPASMAARVNGSSAIVVKSERHLDTFRAGLKSFVNEARLLARFDHPSLVKVYRFWEENGTAYMVMPYYEGPTLKAALAALGRAPSEAELRAWLSPLLDALAVMHASQCYHRDIAPDNILLTPRGPLLLDFGAARRVIGDMTHAITVVLKPGYAPIEQYGDVATMTQGAWTDLYALASVVYYAIVGKTPTSSVERLMEDRLEPLAVTAAGRYGAAFLRAIDAALAVRPGERPQTEREFRALLDADLPAARAAPAPPAPRSMAAPRDDGEATPYRTVPGTLTPELATQPAPRAGATPAQEPQASVESPSVADARQPPGASTLSDFGAPLDSPTLLDPVPGRVDDARAAGPDTATPTPSPIAAPQPGRRRPAAWIALGLVVIAMLAAAAVWLQQRSAVDPNADKAASVAPPKTPSPAATALPASTPSPGVIAPAEPAAVATPRATPAASAAAPIASAAAMPAEAPIVPAPAESAIGRLPDRAERATAAAPAGERPGGEPAGATSTAVAPPARSSRPRRETPIRADAAPSVRAQPPAASISSRCSDILQKASLEPLSDAEAAYLKRECR